MIVVAAEMYSDTVPTEAEHVFSFLILLFLYVIKDLKPQWLASVTPSIYLFIPPSTAPPPWVTSTSLHCAAFVTPHVSWKFQSNILLQIFPLPCLIILYDSFPHLSSCVTPSFIPSSIPDLFSSLLRALIHTRGPKLTGPKGKGGGERKTWTVCNIWHTLNCILGWITCLEPRGTAHIIISN